MFLAVVAAACITAMLIVHVYFPAAEGVSGRLGN
jgi:hypothetical protein